MTAPELIARIRARFASSPVDPVEVFLVTRIILQEVVDSVYDARLINGTPLKDSDLIGVKEFFEECLAVGNPSRTPATMNASAPENPRARTSAMANLEWCPECGHVHVEDGECGFPIGGGRICRCERQVPA